MFYRRFGIVIIGLLLWPEIGSAQHVGIGVKGGVPLTDAFEQTAAVPRFTFTSNTKRYTVGPAGAVFLPHRFEVEVDALYTRLDYDMTVMGVDTFARTATKANSWEFPFLLKKEMTAAKVSPYGDVGIAARHVGGRSHIVNTVFPTHVFEVTTDPPDLVHPWTSGFVVGGGIELRAGPFLLLPEVRYTRWFRESFQASTGVFQSGLNEAQFLLGIQAIRF